MFLVVIWVICAALIGSIASKRGRSGFAWFLLAVIISPILALLFVLASTDRSPARAAPVAIEAEAPPPLRFSRQLGAVVGDGQFRFPIVGESHYQAALAEFAGGYDKSGRRNVAAAAMLVPEADNPYDLNAVAVQIEGQTVGYLARDVAPVFRAALADAGFGRATCEAAIVGGWDRGEGDVGSFGVRLNARMPFSFQAAAQIFSPLEHDAPALLQGRSTGDIFRNFVVATFIILGGAYFVYYQWQARHPAAAEDANNLTGTTIVPRVDPMPVATPPVVPAPKPKPTAKPKPKADPNAPMNLVPSTDQ